MCVGVMGKIRYDKCQELLEKDFKKGDEVGIVKLSTLIIKTIGSDSRTVEETLKTMMTTHLIKDIGNRHWKIL